jgi:predicted nucleic acid-binding protein
MELVVDANIVIAGMISGEGKTSEIFFSNVLNLFSPELLSAEIDKHKPEILAKSGLSGVEFDLVLSLMFSRIRFVSFLEFKQCIAEAREICPDPDDTEYFALALALHCPVWSDDKRLKKQDVVEVISTSELLERLRRHSLF